MTLIRAELTRKHSSLYRKFVVLGEPGGCCFYCGEPQETLDHRPPLNAMYATSPEELQERGAQFLLVPSCQDCNLKLSGKLGLDTLEAALRFLLLKLQSYLRKHGVVWTETELLEMHPDMQVKLRVVTTRTLVLKNRINHIDTRLKNLQGLPITTQR